MNQEKDSSIMFSLQGVQPIIEWHNKAGTGRIVKAVMEDYRELYRVSIL